MSEADDITPWITKLGQGDSRAAQAIWDEYFQRLTQFARKKFDKLPLRVADEEDVALSVINSLCRGVAAGRFPQLGDRQDLWRLLVTIAARKIVTQMRRQHAGKRGGGKVRGESVFANVDGEGSAGIDQVLGREPSPELANIVAEDCARLFDALADESLKQIAQLKLEGYTNDEIAAKLDCATRTVERKLERIRAIWSQEDPA
jgi:DNA-directed RNA polymerase specialized sigma24 family protein